MNIVEAIEKEGLSVRAGSKSLCIETQGGRTDYVVYQRKHRARHMTELVRTDDEDYAVRILLMED